MIDIMSISCEIAFRWMSQDLNDEKSTLVQILVKYYFIDLKTLIKLAEVISRG